MEYIYGRKPVFEALRGRRRVHKIRLAQEAKPSPAIAGILRLAAEKSVPLDRPPKRYVDDLIGDVLHQGVIAEVEPFKYADIADLVASTAENSRALVVALDGVTDPQNLGAVIRTATAAAVDAIILSKHGAAPVTAAVAKASAGLVEYAVIVATNLNNAIDGLKNAGFWVVGADAAAPAPIWDLDLTGKIVLVFGGESEGLSRLVKSKCDFLAKLPLAAPVESLNVSAAAAVMMYEVVRQWTCS
ncbi:MAG: 23S rRNA (guanosine(2251)-2'-O)-methyltransferase RlmB [Actinomycetota bacterium]|nr:23S rRNA (guanosine(2251)-2'-O)-methyltransferase RlmB [Actinomycetota bacterium]